MESQNRKNSRNGLADYFIEEGRKTRVVAKNRRNHREKNRVGMIRICKFHLEMNKHLKLFR